MYKVNGMVKKCWRTLAIMKNVLLINNDFLVNIWAEAMDIINYLYNKLPTNTLNTQLFWRKYRLGTNKTLNTF